MGRVTADLFPGHWVSIWGKDMEARTCLPVKEACFLCLWLVTSRHTHLCMTPSPGPGGLVSQDSCSSCRDPFWITARWAVDAYDSVLASHWPLRRGLEPVLGLHHPPGGSTGTGQVCWASWVTGNKYSLKYVGGKTCGPLSMTLTPAQGVIYICDSGGIRLGQDGVMALACGQWSQMAWVQIPATILLAV